MALRKSVSCGLDFSTVYDLNDCLYNAICLKFDFICIPLVHPQYKREFINGVAKKRLNPFTRFDLALCSFDWSNLVIGKISPYIAVDSKIPAVKKNSEETLYQELALATHLGVSVITLKLNEGIKSNINLARIISETLVVTSSQIWVQVPLENPRKQSYSYRNRECDFYESTWEWWNAFRKICNYNKKLKVTLLIGHDIPDPQEIDRWLAEPVKCIILPTSLFIINNARYPVLSKAHQTLLKKFQGLQIQLLLKGTSKDQNINYFHSYLQHLWKKHETSDSGKKMVGEIQTSINTADFNINSIKWSQYKNAITQAITIISKRKTNKETIGIMVVNDTFGWLIQTSLNVAEMMNQNIKVYTSHKNQDVTFTLQALNKEIWGGQITIMSTDMCDWKTPEKIDIFLSELPDSFTDYELNLQYLNDVQKLMAEDAISIPCQYTLYIKPIQSSKVYNTIQDNRCVDKHPIVCFESLYTARIVNKYDIANSQPLYIFNVLNKDRNIDNSRYEMRTFNVHQNCLLHGFSGYLDVILFENITLSRTLSIPNSRAFDQLTVFFPIKEPIQLKMGDKVVVHFWRRIGRTNVWYEWSISKPVPLPIHNQNGRSSTTEF